MLTRTPFRYLAVLTVAVALAAAATLALPLQAADPALARPKGYQAITKASKDVTVSFVRPGRIVDVLVGKGDTVKAKQLIARLDDAEEQAALKIDEIKSKDETAIHAEEAARDQKAKAAERMRKSGPGVVGTLELEEAELQVKIEEARLQIAIKELETNKLKYQQSILAVDKLKLLAPIDGIVSEEFLKAGENSEGGNMKVVRIVQLDPLWVEVPVPIMVARKLKKDDPAAVTFTDGKDRPGKVAVVSPVGDSASETILVRVEVPNPEKLSSGENVFVNFKAVPTDVAQLPKINQ